MRGMLCFNPRLPGGRRQVVSVRQRNIYAFQSTPSGGKATSCTPRLYGAPDVSIHAFRGEGDGFQISQQVDHILFQSTPSGGKATRHSLPLQQLVNVSIHAFRGEGDLAFTGSMTPSPCFNPRLPGGRRRLRQLLDLFHHAFQSTPSGGKATTTAHSKS